MMRKILSLLVLMLAITSCEEDVKFNTPAVQGLKDNELWKATSFTATLDIDNSLIIEASNGFETLVLRTSNSAPGTYELGLNRADRANFILAADGIEMAYETGTGIGNGEITIKADPAETNLAKGYVSGTFRFNAEDEDGNVLNFQEGIFYKVRIR